MRDLYNLIGITYNQQSYVLYWCASRKLLLKPWHRNIRPVKNFINLCCCNNNRNIRMIINITKQLCTAILLCWFAQNYANWQIKKGGQCC